MLLKNQTLSVVEVVIESCWKISQTLSVVVVIESCWTVSLSVVVVAIESCWKIKLFQ